MYTYMFNEHYWSESDPAGERRENTYLIYESSDEAISRVTARFEEKLKHVFSQNAKLDIVHFFAGKFEATAEIVYTTRSMGFECQFTWRASVSQLEVLTTYNLEEAEG